MQLDAFLPLVMPEVMGCPEPVARSAIMVAANEFCRDTMSWTDFTTPAPIQEGVSDYVLQVPAGGYVVSVLDVWLDGSPMRSATMGELSELLPGWMNAGSSQPAYYNQAKVRGTLTVYPRPVNIASAAPNLIARCAYAPVVSSAVLPDFLGGDYLDAIASGAKSRLMAMPAVTWGNPALATYHKGLFDGAKEVAIGTEARGRVRGSGFVTSRSFGY